MPKIVAPLSDKQINKAKPKARAYHMADGSGLFLTVTPAGSKNWMLRYQRPSTGKTNNLTLGQYPELSLALAREKRTEYRAALATGKDPAQDKLDAQLSLTQTLELTAQRWLLVKGTQVSADYTLDIRRSLELHVYPQLGAIPIEQITAPVVIAELRALETRGTLETLRRVIQRLNEIMVFAVNTGLIPHNTLAGISSAFQAPSTTNQLSIKPDQLPEFMRRLYQASIRSTTRDLILFQLHTMARPAEAAKAQWSQIKGNEWHCPPELMKAGRLHIVPLSDQVLELLANQPRPAAGPHDRYIFAGIKDPRSHLNVQTANMAIKRFGYQNILVAHGLRSLAITTCEDVGQFDAALVDRCLAHQESTRSGVTKSYAAYSKATYLTQRRPVMDWWSAYIQQALISGLSAA
jgi:integrase